MSRTGAGQNNRRSETINIGKKIRKIKNRGEDKGGCTKQHLGKGCNKGPKMNPIKKRRT